MRCMRAFLILALGTAASAQTFLVDAANGPGTNFVDLPAAVAAVPDAAVLLVRAGTYSGFAVTGKGFTILADPNVEIDGSCNVSATAPTQAVTLRGLTWNQLSAPPYPDLLALTDCAGPVLVEACTLPANYGCGSFQCVSLRATRCAALVLRDSVFQGQIGLGDSRTAIESISAVGESWLGASTLGVNGRAAILVGQGSLTIAGNSTIQGGDGYITGGMSAYFPGAAIETYAADLRFLGGAATVGSSAPMNLYFPALMVSASARIAPRVTITDLQGVRHGSDVMPQLTGSGAAIGGTLGATVETEVGDLAILVVGLPGAPTLVPGFLDPFWLDPVAHVFVAVGTQQTTAPIAGTVAVPNFAGFRGLRFHWQAACLGSATGLQATNPVVTLVR